MGCAAVGYRVSRHSGGEPVSGVWSHGKGDRPRPCQIGSEERRIREALAYGLITFQEFEFKYCELLKAGKITRDGRILHAGDE
jgi:hypothetical protein